MVFTGRALGGIGIFYDVIGLFHAPGLPFGLFLCLLRPLSVTYLAFLGLWGMFGGLLRYFMFFQAFLCVLLGVLCGPFHAFGGSFRVFPGISGRPLGFLEGILCCFGEFLYLWGAIRVCSRPLGKGLVPPSIFESI